MQQQLFLDGVLKNSDETESLDGIVVYEVIRIINYTPLFLKEHLQRLQNSTKLRLPFSLSKFDDIIKGIKLIIAANCLETGNIEIQISDANKLLIKIIPHSYPTETMYREGVCLGVLRAERKNPNAKEKNQSLRDCANQLMKTHHFFEVILVDNQGFVTEGSRSNIFFVKENKVFTSPTKAVLQGITREKIFEICHQQKIPIFEKEILLAEIETFEAVFMTGTSPAVLPVQKIGCFNL